MGSYRYSYLLEVAYLGFRYSGYQSMPGQLTIEGMLRKTFEFCFEEEPRYNLISSGRTDAKVSAEQLWVQLFCDQDLPKSFFRKTAKNLPADIHLKSFKKIESSYSILDKVVFKHYQYRIDQSVEKDVFISDRAHYVEEQLDMSLLVKACELLQGEHDFKSFTVKKSKQNTRRILDEIQVSKTDNLLRFDFKAKGFLRYQIRMLMAALIQIGKGELSMEELGLYLDKPNGTFPKIAPGSGLVLKHTSLG